MAEIYIALISASAVLGSALLGFVATIQVQQRRRVREVELNNQALWAYTRGLIDALYKSGSVPPPPPDSMAHLYKPGA